MTPAQQLGVAVARVTEGKNALAPYFGAVLRGLLRRQMPPEMEAALGRSATLAVTADGILYWCAKYVASKSPPELAWDLMHEAQHVCLRHFARAEAIGVTGETMALANLAQDASINEGLRKAWPELGKDGIYPETLGQPELLVWEARYRLLLKDKQAKSAGGAGRGSCGSCATGSGKPVPGQPTEAGRSAAELDRMRKQVAAGVKHHAQTKGIGSLPDGMLVWADSVLAPPKVDWRTKLGKLVRAAVAYRSGAVDLTYTRPSRRQAGVGYGPGRAIMPAMHAPVPRAAVLVDTSGSMDKKRLAAAASELQGVLGAAGAGVTVCSVDAAVHGIREVASIHDALAMLRGGGGTDLGPGLKALAALPNRPSVVVVLSDGEIPHPGEAPPFDVIWCIVGSGREFPFGEVVVVDEDEDVS